MTTPSRLRVGLVQIACTGQPSDNITRNIKGIREAASQGAELVMLQELHNSLYFCQTEDAARFDLAEPIPGPSTERYAAVAQELGIVLVLSLFEQRGTGLYHNTAVVIERDGTIAGQYRKMHIPDDPGYYEKYYFTPGDQGFEPISTSVGRLGVLVCWDQWFPEAARLMRLAGADLLLYPTAIGWEPSDTENEKNCQFNAWQTIQRSHAIANGIPVLSCNRVGHEKSPDNQSHGIDFWGGSFVAGVQGEILAEAPTNKEYLLVTDIDFERSREISHLWPYLRDRRVDAYEDLVCLYRDRQR